MNDTPTRPTRSELDASLAADRREGTKRGAFIVVVAAVVLFAALLLPDPAFAILSVAVAGWALTCAYQMRPGHCEICQARTLLAMPRAYPYVPPHWWDLRPNQRSRFIYVCVRHIGGLMVRRAMLISGVAAIAIEITPVSPAETPESD